MCKINSFERFRKSEGRAAKIPHVKVSVTRARRRETKQLFGRRYNSY